MDKFKNFYFLNNLIGWIIFAVATAVYFLTIEPTASWWDCGEYIATAFKLQVGHPPGAPFFQLAGRIFSLFAMGDTSQVALMINGMSALSSSFTILFLFWSISMIARKLFGKAEELSGWQMIAVFGAASVGSLAYTFSDSFWFSAVEGEVYAMSSFFTAIVFWAILKWDTVADNTGSFRWIILIAYLIGLSVGVHLLNLLAIPAIAFVYYFRKFKPSFKGIVITGVISILVLSLIMYGIIPEVVNLYAHSELLFVNSFGLPFNTGTIFFTLLIISLLVFAIRATISNSDRDKKTTWVLSGLLALLLLTESKSGGSFILRLMVLGVFAYLVYLARKHRELLNTAVLSFAFILIGYSSFLIIIIRANTNTPINENNPSNAISLLSYLNREQYGDWPLFSGPYYNSPIADYEDGNPVYLRDDVKKKYVIADSRSQTIPVYDPAFTTVFPRMWSNQKQIHIREYKRWGEVQGIPISHTGRDGKTETIVKPTFAENLRFFFNYQVGFMYFRYFMWNFAGRQNDIQGHGEIENGNWITGIESWDKNKTGTQENLPFSMKNTARNTFYFLPFLLGLIGLFYQINKDSKNALVVALLFIMTGLAIIVYLNQYPYQPRERDYAYAASFYAFAIWIGIGVIGIISLISKILNNKISALLITILCLGIPYLMAKQGWDDHDRSGKYAARDFAINYLESCEPNAILFTNGDNDTFPLWYAQEVEGIRTDVRVVNYMLASGEWYIHQMQRKVYESDPLPLQLTAAQYDKGMNNYVPFYTQERGPSVMELKDAINFVGSESAASKLDLQNGEQLNYIPTKNLKLTLDSAYLVSKGIVPPEKAAKMPKEIRWTVGQSYLYKNDLMLLDLIANNNWERPVYFASPSAVSKVLNVDKYCHLEGFVYRFLPYEADDYIKDVGGINPDRSYDLLVNKAKWGNLKDPGVYIDPESRRNSIIPRQNYLRLAEALIGIQKADSAIKALDMAQYHFPNEKIPYDVYCLPFVQAYYNARAFDKGSKMAEIIANNYADDLSYYLSQEPRIVDYYSQDIERAAAIIQQLAIYAGQNDQKDLEKKLNKKLEDFAGKIK